MMWRIEPWVAAALMASLQGWIPSPQSGVTEPSEVIAAAPPDDWRSVPLDNLLLMELEDGRQVWIELAPDFAPVHVANVRALARAGWWKAAAIYRSQDNYVVQWGEGSTDSPLPTGVVATPPAEYERTAAGMNIRAFEYPDPYAPKVGHVAGWPVGADPARGTVWLTHCYGSVGVGRDITPDTGTGGELYAVIGHAPRHLDRNIAVIGRVLEGMEHLATIARGREALGFIADSADHVPLTRLILAEDLPDVQKPSFAVMRTDSRSFAAYVKGRANRGGAFFEAPAGGVDLCNAPVPVKRLSTLD